MGRTYAPNSLGGLGDVIDLTEIEFKPTTNSLDVIGEAPNGWKTVYRIDRSTAILVVRSERQRLAAKQGLALKGLTGDHKAAGIELERVAKLIGSEDSPGWVYAIQGAILGNYAGIVASWPEQTLPSSLKWEDVKSGKGGKPEVKAGATGPGSAGGLVSKFQEGSAPDDEPSGSIPSWAWIAGLGAVGWFLLKPKRR